MIDVVAALIAKQDKFLVTKRAYGELKGKWEFPGGKIDENETSTIAIVREIKEELGLDIQAKKEIAEFNHQYPFNNIHLILIQCEVIGLGDSIKSDGSHDDFRWIDLDEALTLEFAPLDKKVIDHIRDEKEYK